MNPRPRGRCRLAVLGLLAGLAVPVFAASAPAPAPAAAAAGEAFDPAQSRADFSVVLRLRGEVQGRFSAIEGALLPAGDGRWRVHVVVDTRGLSVDGPAWMLRSTRSPSFLDVGRYPRIDFTSAPFARDLLRSGGELAGELQLRGQTRDVAFRLEPADCTTPGHGCAIRVRGSVNRRDFGMTSQRLWLRDTVGFDFRVRLRDPAR